MNAPIIIFWTCALVLFYIYAGYPILLLLWARFTRAAKTELGYLPRMSILITARNEEASIRRKLEQTLALDYPPELREILVLSDGSHDHTDEIVREFEDRNVRLLQIREGRGKTNAQNQGMRCARGDVLVFSDATTVYHPQALRYLGANYQDPEIGAVSGRYQYFDPELSPTGTATIAFWNYENRIKMLQSRIATLTGCSGCIYSVRKSAYTPLDPDVISDLVQPLWVVKQGYRVLFEDRALAYEQTTDSTAQEFSMRVRVITRGMRGLLSVPELLKPWNHPRVAMQLISHKVLRWAAPLFWTLLLMSNFSLSEQTGYRLLLYLQVLFYGVALLELLVPLHRRWKVLGIPLYFCTLNAAACLSIFELLRGRKYVVWEPVRR